MPTNISRRLYKLVRRRANFRCEYCQSSEWLTAQRSHVDHIIPKAHGGATEEHNLCLACASCNGSKQDKVEAVDPKSGKMVMLFHPRKENWHDHFAWSQDGLQIIGQTASGRATVNTLKLNRPLVMKARAVWVRVQLHPPKES